MQLLDFLRELDGLDGLQRRANDLQLIGCRHSRAPRTHIESEKSAHAGKLVQLVTLPSHHERKQPKNPD